MLGILVVILISWLLLKLKRKSFSVLGIRPTRIRLLEFLGAFILSLGLAVGYYFYTAYSLKAQTVLNQNYSFFDFITGMGWTFRSALFEELVFRGVLLYFLIQYLGKSWAIVLSSLVFGVFHWFSYNIIGNTQAMISVFLLTFTAGAVFAYAFMVTRSVYLQTALHFGWNLASINIFSQGPLGDQLLKVSVGNSPNDLQSLVFFLLQLILIPGIMFIYIRLIRKKKIQKTEEFHQMAQK